MVHPLLPGWLTSAMVILALALFFVAWALTFLSLVVGPCSSTPLSRRLLWRIAPTMAVAAFVIGAMGLAGHYLRTQ